MDTIEPAFHAPHGEGRRTRTRESAQDADGLFDLVAQAAVVHAVQALKEHTFVDHLLPDHVREVCTHTHTQTHTQAPHSPLSSDYWRTHTHTHTPPHAPF